MLPIVVHKNMKLGDHTLNNEKLSLVNTKFLIKKKMTVNLENRFKNDLSICLSRPKYLQNRQQERLDTH